MVVSQEAWWDRGDGHLLLDAHLVDLVFSYLVHAPAPPTGRRCLPPVRFKRLLYEMAQKHKGDIGIDPVGIDTLQVACEAYLAGVLLDGFSVARNHGRALEAQDLSAVCSARSVWVPQSPETAARKLASRRVVAAKAEHHAAVQTADTSPSESAEPTVKPRHEASAAAHKAPAWTDGSWVSRIAVGVLLLAIFLVSAHNVMDMHILLDPFYLSRAWPVSDFLAR
eukprot:TRINITY_DN36972_c0_g1_i1.p1 TRINITY_DN36972_c0_g1~~TRINITY_DN36972_c0_g1_i1.p1  ORF type:complete len:224 (+),score=25.66 TRINITY_DN36972_c0_g1_i1:412-1083(+)